MDNKRKVNQIEHKEETSMGTGIVSRKKTDIETLTGAKDVSMKKSLEGTDEKFMT